ncbi:hypothetical protein J8J20_25155, partial [Mycobacterium tuberculosis]|nr:hypothetical protein [Mycobacterium tuberculosis]
ARDLARRRAPLPGVTGGARSVPPAVRAGGFVFLRSLFIRAARCDALVICRAQDLDKGPGVARVFLTAGLFRKQSVSFIR